MAISVTHTFVSPVSDELRTDEVGPDEWNAAHTLTGFGTGVETALAVDIGTAGSVVVNGGALGTPSSGTVTNLTGTASININGTVGATTPTTGAFTTIAASSNVTITSGTLSLTGNISAAAWTTSGIRYKNVASTLTDTSSSGTVATAYTNAFGGNTIAASSATTYTNYFNSYFVAPSAGTNVTLTNSWGLGADNIKVGTSNQFSVGTSGHVTVEGVTSTGATGTGNLVFDTSPTLSNPVVGTQSARDNSTKAASTAYVDGATRERLTGNRTYYVRTDGSDSNTGLTNSAGGAFATWQHAIDVVHDTLDLAGYYVTLQAGGGTGTWTECAMLIDGPFVGTKDEGLAVVIAGDDTTPSNYVLRKASGDALVSINACSQCYIHGFKLISDGVPRLMYAVEYSMLYADHMEFGDATGYMHITADIGSFISINGPITFSGNATRAFASYNSSLINVRGAITLTGTPAFSYAFAESSGACGIQFYSDVTFTGSATGKRYEASYQGYIYNDSGSALPGSTAGSTNTFGYYYDATTVGTNLDGGSTVTTLAATGAGLYYDGNTTSGRALLGMNASSDTVFRLYSTPLTANIFTVDLSTPTFNFSGALLPTTSDGAALGSATKMWSDLFLASGAVLNFNAGDVTLTHAADTLTLSGDTLGSLVFAHSGTLEATTTTAASATFAGGVGIAKKLYVGGGAVVSAGAGVTALTVNGVASSLYIDYTGSGNNYLDATSLYIRNFAGSTKFILDTASTYLTIQGSAAAGYSQTIYSNAGGDSAQFGIGGASSAVGRNSFVYTAAAGFVTTWDATSAMSAGKMTVAYTTASTSTTTGALVVSGGVGVAGAAYIGGAISVAGTISTFSSGSAFCPQVTVWNYTNDANGAYFIVLKGRAISGAGSAVQVGDTLGTFLFQGVDSNGTQARNSCALSAVVTAVGATTVTSNFAFTGFGLGATILTLVGADGQVQIGTTTAASSNTTGALKVAGGAGFAKDVYLATGTTAIAPLTFTSGTNLTTARAGGVEFDGTCFYATAAASSRQVVNAEQFATVQGSAVALSNSSTSAQNVFAAANDTLTVAASTTYYFEGFIYLTTGTTSHTTAFGFGGTATFTSILYHATLVSAAATTIATSASFLEVKAATATVLNAASTAAATKIWVRGTMRINGAGTIIPQITFSAGPTGTCQTEVNSYFRLWPVGSNTVAAVGNWA